MPSTDAPTWWADVQQEREDLVGSGRRPADDWLGEDIEFVPRRRMAAAREVELLTAGDIEIARTRKVELTTDASLAGDDDQLHGVFVPVSAAAPRGRDLDREGRLARPIAEAETRAGSDGAALDVEIRTLHAADDPFAVPPPPPGQRRTIQITGRPGHAQLLSMARRHRPRTASDRVGHRPDRIALWAVVLGALLIILAATSSSSQAATIRHVATTPQAHVVHVAHVRPAAPRHLG